MRPSGRSMVAQRAPLPRPLAGAYVAVVVLVWLGHAVGVVLFVVSGRTPWTTDDPAGTVPAFLLVAGAVGVVWSIERRLHADRRRSTAAVRMIGLAYGAALPTAWRRLRERTVRSRGIADPPSS